MLVALSLPELSVALNAAWMRIVASAAMGINHKTTYDRPISTRIREEFIGACGEIAVGKASGEFFVPSVGTFHRVPDCLGDCEVRSTEVASGSLIVRDNDSDDRRYILAVISNDEVNLVGWIRGADAKKPEWLRNPHGHREAWFVPQSSLMPIEEVFGCHSNLPSPSPSSP